MAMALEAAMGMVPTVAMDTVPGAATAPEAVMAPVTDMAKAPPPAVAATGIPTATVMDRPRPCRSTCARSSRRC